MLITVLTALATLAIANGQVVEDCRKDMFPPDDNTELSTVIVNLNLPAEERWKEAILPVKEEIIELISTITSKLFIYYR